MKNEIANNPVANMTELKERLHTNFQTLVTPKILLSSWHKTVAHLKEYAAWSTDTADCSDDPEEERRAGGDPLEESAAWEEEHDLNEALDVLEEQDAEEELLDGEIDDE